ncbi:MAG: hypothetical protein COB09_14840 [Thalassobium sp.]|nr:MAG: hypothetical protein COB09_14840 [Thalassobium sp.]
MKIITMPQALHEVFGEQQTIAEIMATLTFALTGSAVMYFFLYQPANPDFNWKTILGLILVADVFAGCIANFTHGTNRFYAERPKGRLIFILIHVHILAIAWLLNAPFEYALLTWAFTIASALVINQLKNHALQKFSGAAFMCFGLFLLILLPMPQWFLLCSVFFMIKVVFSFAVDHYAH